MDGPVTLALCVGLPVPEPPERLSAQDGHVCVRDARWVVKDEGEGKFPD